MLDVEFSEKSDDYLDPPNVFGCIWVALVVFLLRSFGS